MKNYISPVVKRESYHEQAYNLPASTYAVPSVVPEATGTLALTASTGVVSPNFIDRPLRLTDVGVVVTSAAGEDKLVRIGLYEWDPVARALGSLVEDFGTVAADQTSIQKISDLEVDVKAGWYAWVVVSDGTPTLRAVISAERAVAGTFTVSTTNLAAPTHYTATLTGAVDDGLPETGPAVTAATSNSEYRQNYFVVTRYGVRVA